MLHSDTKRIYGLFKVIYKCSTVKEQIGHSVLQPILIAKPIGILAIVQNVAKICRPFQQINSMQ